MPANAKSLSTQASLTQNQSQVVPATVVNAIFTLNQGVPGWIFDPPQVKSGDLQFGVIYCLSPSSTPGWGFTKITIEDAHHPPAWSFSYPNSSGTERYKVPGELEVMVTDLKPALSSLLIDNLNNTVEPQTVSVRLTVSDSQGKSFTSPDPQIILEPR